jgi:hypothetical protein
MGKAYIYLLIFFTPIWEDQCTISNAHMHLRRTIEVFYIHRENKVVMGKDHMHLWERPSSDGKDLHALVGRIIHTFHTQHSVAKAMKVRSNTITLFNVCKVVNHKIQMIA